MFVPFKKEDGSIVYQSSNISAYGFDECLNLIKAATTDCMLHAALVNETNISYVIPKPFMDTLMSMPENKVVETLIISTERIRYAAEKLNRQVHQYYIDCKQDGLVDEFPTKFREYAQDILIPEAFVDTLLEEANFNKPLGRSILKIFVSSTFNPKNPTPTQENGENHRISFHFFYDDATTLHHCIMNTAVIKELIHILHRNVDDSNLIAEYMSGVIRSGSVLTAYSPEDILNEYFENNKDHKDDRFLENLEKRIDTMTAGILSIITTRPEGEFNKETAEESNKNLWMIDANDTYFVDVIKTAYEARDTKDLGKAMYIVSSMMSIICGVSGMAIPADAIKKIADMKMVTTADGTGVFKAEEGMVHTFSHKGGSA